MSGEIVRPDNKVATPEQASTNLVAMAIQQGFDAEGLMVLYQLQKEEREFQAKAAYKKAFAEFSAEAGPIVKDKTVEFTSQRTGKTTSYKHATLAAIMGQIMPLLSKRGLSVSWRTPKSDDNVIVSVTTVISHEDGHEEETTLSSGLDNSGQKNAIQQMGSTITYLQRYGVVTLCGLSTYDDDDGSSADTIDEEKIAIMEERIDKYIDNAADFLGWVGVQSVDAMTPQHYKTAMAAIEDIRKQRGA